MYYTVFVRHKIQRKNWKCNCQNIFNITHYKNYILDPSPLRVILDNINNRKVMLTDASKKNVFQTHQTVCKFRLFLLIYFTALYNSYIYMNDIQDKITWKDIIIKNIKKYYNNNTINVISIDNKYKYK
jgi:hypothetical protein